MPRTGYRIGACGPDVPPFGCRRFGALRRWCRWWWLGRWSGWCWWPFCRPCWWTDGELPRTSRSDVSGTRRMGSAYGVDRDDLPASWRP